MRRPNAPKPQKLAVIFRMDTHESIKEVTAVFPSLYPYPGRMVCYAHIGQHSECCDAWYYNRTRPATPEEYTPLLKELQQVYGGTYEGDPDGHTLIVQKRRSNKR